MPVHYEIDCANGVVIARPTGVITIGDLLEYVRNLREDLTHKPAMKELVDLRHVDTMELNYTDMTSFTSIIKSLGFKKSAVVAPNDFLFGMARMYQILLDVSGVDVMASRDYSEALRWLDMPYN